MGAVLAVLWLATLSAAPRFADEVAGRLRTEFPAAKVTIADDANIDVEFPDQWSVRMNLDNVSRQCATTSSCKEALDRLIASMRDGLESATAPVKLGELRVRLGDKEYLELLQKTIGKQPAKGGEDRSHVTKELVPGLWQVLVVDRPDSMRGLTRADAKKLGKPDAELLSAAIENLRTNLPAPTFQQTVFDAKIRIQASTTDGYDSAYVLLPAALLKALGPAKTGWLIAIPNRDTLLAAGAESSAALEAAAAKLYAQSSHPVSAKVFKLTAKGLEP